MKENIRYFPWTSDFWCSSQIQSLQVLYTKAVPPWSHSYLSRGFSVCQRLDTENVSFQAKGGHKIPNSCWGCSQQSSSDTKTQLSWDCTDHDWRKSCVNSCPFLLGMGKGSGNSPEKSFPLTLDLRTTKAGMGAGWDPWQQQQIQYYYGKDSMSLFCSGRLASLLVVWP